MSKLQHDVSVRAVKAVNPVLITLPFAGAWFAYYASRLASPFYYWGNWVVVGLFFLLYITFCRIYDGFLFSTMRISELVYSQALAALISNGILYVVLCLLSKRLANPLPLLFVMAMQIALAALWSFLAHQWYFGKYPPSRSAIIYDAREGLERLVQEYGLEKKFQIFAAMPVQEALANKQALDNMETVFLSGIHSHDRNILLKYCVEHDIIPLPVFNVRRQVLFVLKQGRKAKYECGFLSD